MKPAEPFDYIAAIDQLRQEEQSDKNQIHDPDYIPTRSDEPVDYLAVSRAWEKLQIEQCTIHTAEQRSRS